jgi:hypothetical protein
MQMMVYQTFMKAQSNRYWVALSLEEAETVRGIIHSPAAASALFASGTAIALRCGPILLDATKGLNVIC